MSEYRISTAARMAGFAPSALRFYEDAGLLPAPARTPAGYRTYDDVDVERLRFVHRARQLGLPLEEIRDLVAVWNAGVCAPTQQGLAERIAARRAAVTERIGELTALHTQLLAAEHAVANADGAGACGPGCACLATPQPGAVCGVATGPQPIELSSSAIDVGAGGPAAAPPPPLACTLAPGEVPLRLAAWGALVGDARTRQPLPGGQRLSFDQAPGLLARVAELAAAEQECCPFLTFTIALAQGGLTLDVTAPGGAAELVAALLDAGR